LCNLGGQQACQAGSYTRKRAKNRGAPSSPKRGRGGVKSLKKGAYGCETRGPERHVREVMRAQYVGHSMMQEPLSSIGNAPIEQPRISVGTLCCRSCRSRVLLHHRTHGSFDSIVTGLADELCDGAFMHGNWCGPSRRAIPGNGCSGRCAEAVPEATIKVKR
jgi:hypothetical protein